MSTKEEIILSEIRASLTNALLSKYPENIWKNLVNGINKIPELNKTRSVFSRLFLKSSSVGVQGIANYLAHHKLDENKYDMSALDEIISMCNNKRSVLYKCPDKKNKSKKSIREMLFGIETNLIECINYEKERAMKDESIKNLLRETIKKIDEKLKPGEWDGFKDDLQKTFSTFKPDPDTSLEEVKKLTERGILLADNVRTLTKTEKWRKWSNSGGQPDLRTRTYYLDTASADDVKGRLNDLCKAYGMKREEALCADMVNHMNRDLLCSLNESLKNLETGLTFENYNNMFDDVLQKIEAWEEPLFEFEENKQKLKDYTIKGQVKIVCIDLAKEDITKHKKCLSGLLISTVIWSRITCMMRANIKMPHNGDGLDRPTRPNLSEKLTADQMKEALYWHNTKIYGSRYDEVAELMRKFPNDSNIWLEPKVDGNK